MPRWTKKQPTLCTRPEIPLEAERVNGATHENIEEWFTRIGKEINPSSFRKELIFNMDETMIDFNSKKVRVVSPKERALIRMSAGEHTMHITCVLCIAADGSHVTTTLILPKKEFPDDLEHEASEFHWAGQDAGWMTQEIFGDWITKVFKAKLCSY